MTIRCVGRQLLYAFNNRNCHLTTQILLFPIVFLLGVFFFACRSGPLQFDGLVFFKLIFDLLMALCGFLFFAFWGGPLQFDGLVFFSDQMFSFGFVSDAAIVVNKHLR